MRTGGDRQYAAIADNQAGLRRTGTRTLARVRNLYARERLKRSANLVKRPVLRVVGQFEIIQKNTADPMNAAIGGNS